MDPLKLTGTDGDLTTQHAAQFPRLHAQPAMPNADIEQGHLSTTMSLLSKISLAVRQRLEWDPQAEQVTNCPEANDMLHYEYRKPWTLG